MGTIVEEEATCIYQQHSSIIAEQDGVTAIDTRLDTQSEDLQEMQRGLVDNCEQQGVEDIDDSMAVSSSSTESIAMKTDTSPACSEHQMDLIDQMFDFCYI